MMAVFVAATALACAGHAPVAGFAPGQAALADALVPGRAVELALRPARDVSFVPPPAKAPPADSFAAEVPLTIKAAGTYRLELGSRAWVDVVRDGAAVASTDHGHGADCSGIAKTVAFRLEPGAYRVQLSGAPARAITVRVVRALALPDKK